MTKDNISFSRNRPLLNNQLKKKGGSKKQLQISNYTKIKYSLRIQKIAIILKEKYQEYE